MVKDKIVKAIQKTGGVKDVHLETPEIEAHGDYSCNVAMQMAAKGLKLKKTKTPKELAEELVEKLSKDKTLAQLVGKIEVAGPGFINFWLSKDYLLKELVGVVNTGGDYGRSKVGQGKTVVVEYSSPNIARRFSVGHLRSTIIGQALFNLYDFLGYKTIGENHLGDWGTQFGVIIAQVIDKGLDIRKLSINEIEELYVDFSKKAQENPSLKKKASSWFKRLEEGDKQARKIWKDAVSVSLKEFGRIWDLLGVKIENAHGESFYEDKMQAVIDEARNKGLAKKSKGAEIIEIKGMPPVILLKSDGGTTYHTRDLAAVRYRLDTWNPDSIIYEVGSEQSLHFKQVFAAAKLLGWIKDQKLVHVPHGLFLFEGKKMSTRKGTTVKLEEVLKEAIKRAKKLGSKDEKTARAVGVGAIKYFDLSHQPTSNINFDWEQTLALEGNSGPYLQYTYARTQSVLDKAGQYKTLEIKNQDINQEEMILLRSFPQFSGVTIDAAKNYSPNLLCNYLYDLAQKYNTFYNKHRIIGSKNERLRIMLTAAVGQILKNGLTLLGIEAPSRM